MGLRSSLPLSSPPTLAREVLSTLKILISRKEGESSDSQMKISNLLILRKVGLIGLSTSDDCQSEIEGSFAKY